MSPALTTSTWIATLNYFVRTTNDDTTRTLAQMLREIAEVSNDPIVADVFDTYGSRLLEKSP